MSNKNRRKAKTFPVHFSDDEDDEAVVMDIEKAEALIAKSGPGGQGYFDASPSKRQRQDAASPEDKDESKKDDVDLMMELGWVKDPKEADEMMAEQKHSLESGETIGSKDKTRTADGDGNSGGKQLVKNRREKRGGGKPSNTPYDYSKVGAIGVGGGAVGDNPFFAGAGISGGTLNNGGSGKGGKKQTNPRKGGQGAKKSNYGGGNKTHVYRK